jgi:DsbC/DsbD-like thiol-disulfide interchange protein
MMPILFLPARHAAAIFALCGAVTMASPCAAADASQWDTDAHSATRLIAGAARGTQGDGALRAGLEIKLQPGWKTYWRYPGDSGVPPRFDFSASTNVKDVTVLWPAPMRFKDGNGFSIGYDDQLILPLHVQPADARIPVVLRVKLDYAICEKLCLPVEARLELALSSSGGAHEAPLTASEARVPQRVAIGANGPLTIVAVKQEAGARVRMVVDVKAPEATALDLFAEGPTAEWSLPLPEPVAGAPAGLRRFSFEIDGAPSGAKTGGVAVTLTAVTPAHAVEVVAHLD